MTRRPKSDSAAETMKPQQPTLPDEVIDEAKRAVIYGVGYKRPPKNKRFKKGQSGNPRGRPKNSDIGIGGSRSANTLALREAERLIDLKDATGTRRVLAIEAVYRAQYAAAAKGNAYAQKHIIERHDRAERARRRQILDSIEFWQDYVGQCRGAIAEAERRGETPPTQLPHPDDVVIDHERGVRIIGPIDEEEAAELEKTCKLRDVLIMQHALDWREADKAESGDQLDEPGTALLFAHWLEQNIPARNRLSDYAKALRIMDFEAMPKRELRKALYRAWRAIGFPARRGKTFPPMRVGKDWLEFFLDLLQRTRDGRLDVANSTPAELAAAIEEIILGRHQGVDAAW